MKTAVASASLGAVNNELARGRDVSIINLVEALLGEAHERGASDIHLKPNEQGLSVRLRIDGVLQVVHTLPKEIHEEVIARIKVLSWLRTDEHQAAQDGRFRIALEDAAIDVRVSITPTYYGENAVLRLLADNQGEHSLQTLGFSPEDEKKILRAIKKPHGMILSTGPTGSGKTTTLYTLIRLLNNPEVSIITVEDPIEYAIDDITQIQINPASGLTFSSGLRSILRQDPNIIMVGEIRDTETAAIAVNTALTGHLLLSTLHTSDAATTLPRLLDMGVDPYLVASTANLAIGQRLLRRLCKKCKVPHELTDTERESLEESLGRPIEKGAVFYKGKGCTACHGTGYRGRMGINEVMVIDAQVRDAILRKAAASVLRELAVKNGMTTMFEDGYQKALAGHTSVAELLRTISE
jgi:type II secretory ATPase GspE/PulE/Tfp pilus assembly ATPase PilB-like protein